MIAVGKPDLTPVRRAMLETGTILALTDDDTVVRMWLGEAPGVDLLAAETLDSNGTRFLFSRLRFHMDDKVLGSSDHKEVCQVACGPEIPGRVWDGMLETCLRAAPARLGIPLRMECYPVGGPVPKFLEVLKREGPAFGFRISLVEFDQPKGGEA